MTMLLVAAGMSAAAAVPQPKQNIQPTPNFMNACIGQGVTSEACLSDTVAAINSARADEAMLRYPLLLPDNFRSLSAARQLFVVLNLERVDRGLRPIVGMVPSLNRSARVSAAIGVDPDPSTRRLRRLGVRTYRTVFAQAAGVLAADFEWLYHDGYTSGSPSDTTNVNCPYPDAAGCWAHREAILDRFSRARRVIGGMGSANAPGSAERVTAILAWAHGPAPRYTYTWRQALGHGADGHRRR
jgi:hypothetical protein